MYKNRILSILYLISIISTSLISQTNQWKISWDQNPESDISKYIIYRGSTETTTTQVGVVNYPATVFTDKEILRGELFFYRIKARNTSDVESNFSEAVSAAVPKLDFPASVKNIVLASGSSQEIDLDLYVTDPDHADNLLSWDIAPGNLLTLNYSEPDHKLTISTPANWTSQEYVDITVTDPDGFFDFSRVGVFSDSTSIPNQGPNIYAYPIPYQPQNSGGIHFANIQENSTLYIYNFLGEPVFKANDISENYVWDTCNDSGKEVASGLFIYHIKTKGKTTTGKLVIVR